MNKMSHRLNRGYRVESSLVLGNRSLRSSDYASAIFYYLHTIQKTPVLGKTVAGNLAIARHKHLAAQQNKARKRVAVCGWELSHQAAERVYCLADYYGAFSDVAVIGSLFPSYGREIWQPFRNASIPQHTITIEDESRFLAQAIELVSAYPFDIVHLSKSRAPNLLFGILYKLIWDAKIIVDIDNNGLAFAGVESPLSIDEIDQTNGNFFELKNLDGTNWTRLAVGLAHAFDGVTVADIGLQQRFGGEIIGHPGVENRYQSALEQKHKGRGKFALPPDKKIILFFNTSVGHKELMVLAETIEALPQTETMLMVVNDSPISKSTIRLLEKKKLVYRTMMAQDFDSIHDAVAIADICLYLHSSDISASSRALTTLVLTSAETLVKPALSLNHPNLKQQLCQLIDEVNNQQSPVGENRVPPEQQSSFELNSQCLQNLVASLDRTFGLSAEMAKFVQMSSVLDNRLPALLHSYGMRHYHQPLEIGAPASYPQTNESYADSVNLDVYARKESVGEEIPSCKPLPTGLQGIKLNPVNELEFDASDSGYWVSLGEDPYFQLVLNEHQPLDPGWYRIDLIIEGWCKKSVAKFYIDYGYGYSENNIYPVPYTSEQLATRVIHLPEPAYNLRFDPQENKGRFRIIDFRISRVRDDEAAGLMLDQLVSSPEYEGKSAQQIQDEILAKTPGQSYLSPAEIIKIYDYIFLSPQSKINYTDWVNYIESNDLPKPAEIASNIATLKNKVLFSIIMPVYNTDETFLRECIDSVIAQAYPHWELCIADDASPKPHVRQVLDHYADLDKRIRIVYCSENGHISRASNSALEIAQGEFVVLLDHDDVLPEVALYFMALAVNENPYAHIFYSDEDKLDLNGNRVNPHFKSDWNPDLFFSQNYVSHLGVYRRELLKRIQGFRAGVEGSQDQDLLLRCLPFVKPEEIIHIPRVLYHWRVSEGSTALASGEKTYTSDAGIKSLQDFFKDQGMHDVTVNIGLVPNTYRVQYPMPTPEPLVSLLIPTRDMLSVLKPCIRSILDKTTYQNYEIIILDNGSVEAETLSYFKSIQAEDHRIKVIAYDYPFNYSAINNFGVKHAKGELIGLINNDIEVISPEWLSEMASHALRPEIGCVGAKLYYDDDTIQHAGVIVGLGGVAGHSHKNYLRHDVGYFHRLILVQNLSAVTAACLVIRKAVFEEVGGLEEERLKVAFNDVDFCLKVREAGYRNLWTPYAELYHHESKSRGSEDTPEKIERFNSEIAFISSKWGEILKLDPYYNPNLTISREDFSL